MSGNGDTISKNFCYNEIMLPPKFWKKYFEVYDVLNLVIPYQELLGRIVKELNLKGGEKVLEAGSGTGNLSLTLKKAGAKVYNLDFSEAAISIHKRKDPEAIIKLWDLNNLPLPYEDNFFDAIVSNNTLYNIPRENRLAVIKDLKRVLKSGGEIVISNIHKNYRPISIYFDTIKKNMKREGPIKTIGLILKMLIPTLKMFYYNFLIQKEHKLKRQNLFDFEEQKKLLEKAGFVDISETKFVFSNQAVLNSAHKPYEDL
jgi:ubiquinone/menaquinone biosynthesis C-methylase UbiE